MGLQSTSEDQLDPQLDLARGRACACNPAVSRIDVPGPGHSALTEDGAAGKRKVGVVWNVEHLSPELNHVVFRKFHSLQERKVQVRQPRTGQNISAEVAVKANRGQGEARRVEPMLHRGVGCRVAAGNVTRTSGRAPERVCRNSGRDVEGVPAMGEEHSAELPSFDKWVTVER